MYFRYNATTKLFQVADTPTDPETAFTNMQLDAAQLTQGTVAAARLADITNTQISASAAIAWSKLSKSGSSLADLATKSAADLTSGILPNARTGQTISYTPTLHASSGSPAVGTGGSLTGSYRRVGQLVHTQFHWILGTGFAFGTYPWGISLPFSISAATDFCSMEALDSGVNAYRLIGVLASIGGIACVLPHQFAAARNPVSTTAPFTWVAGDALYGSVFYRTEAAQEIS